MFYISCGLGEGVGVLPTHCHNHRLAEEKDWVASPSELSGCEAARLAGALEAARGTHGGTDHKKYYARKFVPMNLIEIWSAMTL